MYITSASVATFLGEFLICLTPMHRGPVLHWILCLSFSNPFLNTRN
uniref:Uncharacterized protein n=1 Tax=Anguilla anguilla TaxID=7936 RepID=A0A0E9RQ06_ANGAN